MRTQQEFKDYYLQLEIEVARRAAHNREILDKIEKTEHDVELHKINNAAISRCNIIKDTLDWALAGKVEPCITIKQVLEYETLSRWWPSWLWAGFLQNCAADYLAWLTNKKYTRFKKWKRKIHAHTV